MPDKKKTPVCPVCGAKENKELWRSSYFILYSCLDCGSNYQSRFRKVPKEYDASYFEGNHLKAYGKTYLEDEKNIRNFSRRRLDTILGMLDPSATKELLDIGSALGIFCHEAVKKGFRAEGLEISRFARQTAKKYYGIESHPDMKKIKKKKYGCVTMWFTLEHLEDPDGWISKAASKMENGGILALSVPNGRGAYARFNPSRYHIARPAEHFFEPSIPGISSLLKKHGFKIVRTEIFGLHPERIGLPKLGAVKFILKFMKWGDTFEIYARLKK